MSRRHERGQGLVEFSLLVPVFCLLLLGMLEFGIAFTHDQTLVYATREGARTGATLGAGNTGYPCTTTDFDAPIIAAVERVITSTGSPIALSQVTSISVYLSQSNGTPVTGKINTWSPTQGEGPIFAGKALDFTQTSSGWAPCTRNNGVNADGLGVSVSYTYNFQTSLSGILKFLFGTSGSGLAMSDKTVMTLNPTSP